LQEEHRQWRGQSVNGRGGGSVARKSTGRDGDTVSVPGRAMTEALCKTKDRGGGRVARKSEDRGRDRVSMEWLRLEGSLKNIVSFADYRLLNRALLQKRPIKALTHLRWTSPIEETKFCKRDL